MSTATLLREAISLHQRGAVAEAATRYAQVLKREPKNVEALFYAGLAHCQRGQFAEAATILKRTVALAPRHPGAQHLLGLALKDLGKTDEALRAFDQATTLQPDFVDAHIARATALMAAQRWSDAVLTFDRALAIAPQLVEAWCNRGVSLGELGRHHEAVSSYERALALQPNLPEAHANKGNALAALGRDSEAVESFDRALAQRPDFAAVHINRGNSLRRLARLDQALASYDSAIRIEPQSAEAQFSRGCVEEELGRFGDAIDSFDRALALLPNHPSASGLNAIILSHRAWAANQAGRFDEAFPAIERAQALAPESDGIRYQAAFIELLHGRWREAWPKHESPTRYQTGLLAEFAAGPWPRWTGEPLRDELLVLVTEQGLGDAIHFASFAAELAARGMQVAIFTSPVLAPLLSSLPGLAGVFTQADELAGRTICWLPLMSVPGILGTSPETVPQRVPYLVTDPARVQAWRDRLGSGRKVGIAWQGNVQNLNDRGRSLPLASLAPLASIPGLRLLSLQKGAGTEQLATVPFRDRIETPLDQTDVSGDALVETAALLMTLDLVVTSESMLAHLAGALGRPVFVALRKVPDWRWLLGRDDSPFYPSARLFRQPTDGDWTSVAERMAEATRVLLGSST